MAGSKKPNPLLAAFEAKKEAEFSGRQARLSEIDLIAHLLSCHEDLGVDPGRAEKCLNGFLESKLEVAEAIIRESDEDDLGEFSVTQRDLARQLKSILGADNWQKYQHMFPMLEPFWDSV